LEALAAGADDYLTKPTSTQDGSGMTVLRSQIADKIRQFFPAAPAEATPVATQRTAMTRLHPRCVAVGVSTGGPNALAEVIPALPIGFPLPVFIVQHMPPMFTRLLAERLRSMSRLPVFEASDGMEVVPGQVYLAPGDYHMQVQRYGERFAIALDQGAPENFCRPAVDVLFRSIGKAYGGAAIAVILTGMGQDGLRGSTELHQQGACVIAQDEASSVVWGMPGYVVRAGLADVVCPLGEVAGSVLARTR
jgi:two-component system chemotaxis response regulator CheB